jgi:hypothetical protein
MSSESNPMKALYGLPAAIISECEQLTPVVAITRARGLNLTKASALRAPSV